MKTVVSLNKHIQILETLEEMIMKRGTNNHLDQIS